MNDVWKARTVGQVCLPMTTAKPQSEPDVAFEYIDVSSVSKESLSIVSTQTLLGKDAPSRARRQVRADDVLFATIRPTLRRVTVVPPSLDGQVCSTGYFVARPNPELILSRFLYFYLQSDTFIDAMEALQKGASYPAVTDAEVRHQRIPVPPLAEQARIVRILDEALDAIDIAQANTKANIANAESLLDAELDAILERAQTSSQERRLVDVCKRVTVGHVGSMAAQYQAAGVPFLRSMNIRPFEIQLDGLVFIDQEFHARLKKSRLSPGDLAIVRTGYPGTAAVIPDTVTDANCSDLVIVRPSPGVSADYLCLFFNSPRGKRAVAGNLVGAAQKHFNVKAAKEALIPIPSQDEQRRLSAQCQAVRIGTQDVRRTLDQRCAELDLLRSTVLLAAFSGSL